MKRLPTWSLPWGEMTDRLGQTLVGNWKWEPFGPDGVRGVSRGMTCIVTASREDSVEWVHASAARQDRLPSYFDLVALHKGVWGKDGFAYQVFAASDRHVSIHDRALHLWGRADGKNVLPDFGAEGTI